MYPRLGIRRDVAQFFKAEYIGKGSDANHAGCLEFISGLAAECVTVDDEAYPTKAFCRQKSVKQSDCQLRLTSAGRHSDQHGPLILVEHRLDRLDCAALIRPQW